MKALGHRRKAIQPKDVLSLIERGEIFFNVDGEIAWSNAFNKKAGLLMQNGEMLDFSYSEIDPFDTFPPPIPGDMYSYCLTPTRVRVRRLLRPLSETTGKRDRIQETIRIMMRDSKWAN